MLCSSGNLNEGIMLFLVYHSLALSHSDCVAGAWIYSSGLLHKELGIKAIGRGWGVGWGIFPLPPETFGYAYR